MKSAPLIEILQKSYPDLPRKELYARIMCGEVFVNGECIKDPKQRIKQTVEPVFESRRYVSRGGLKLEAALKRWDLPVVGKVFVDAGASTGGFTDCLLQYGARLVHAVDVGYNQLDYRLRQDRRVRVHERTNIMTVSRFDPMPHAAVADLSFRSIRKAAVHLLSITREGWMVALVKPQFEIDADIEEDFSGIVRSADSLKKVLLQVASGLEEEGIEVLGIIPSPITGRRGNREFLFSLRAGGNVLKQETGGWKAAGLRESLVKDALDQLKKLNL